LFIYVFIYIFLSLFFSPGFSIYSFIDIHFYHVPCNLWRFLVFQEVLRIPDVSPGINWSNVIRYTSATCQSVSWRYSDIECCLSKADIHMNCVSSRCSNVINNGTLAALVVYPSKKCYRISEMEWQNWASRPELIVKFNLLLRNRIYGKIRWFPRCVHSRLLYSWLIKEYEDFCYVWLTDDCTPHKYIM
jgi:hypothetical protein